MKVIQVFDPPMCCPTGICGPDVAPDLINFAAMLSQLGSHGVKIERYNLAQQPAAFVQNTAINDLIRRDCTSVLPVIILDGEVRFQGRYPTRDERPQFFRDALAQPADTTS